jgi:hypothetical protein
MLGKWKSDILRGMRVEAATFPITVIARSEATKQSRTSAPKDWIASLRAQ